MKFKLFHKRNKFPSPLFVKISLLSLVFIGVVFALYSLVTESNDVSVVSTASSCPNNIKSVSLGTQCGERSFRLAGFECSTPVQSDISSQFNASTCYNIDQIYNITNTTCSQCVVADVPSLSFDPSPISVSISKSFDTSVMVNTSGIAANGVGAKITFDPEYVLATSVTPEGLFANYVDTSIDNRSGKINISAVSSSLSDSFTGKGKLATITFKAIKTGSSTISFNFIPGSTIDSNIAVTTGNGDILEAVYPLNVSILRTSNFRLPGGRLSRK